MSDLDKRLDKMQFAITRNMGIQAQFSQLRNFLQDGDGIVFAETEAGVDDTLGYAKTKDLFDEVETGPSDGETD